MFNNFFKNVTVIVSLLVIIECNLLAKSFEVEDVMILPGGYSPTSVLKINDKGNVIGLHYLNQRHQIFFYDNSTKSIFEIQSINTKYNTYPLDFNDNDTIIGYTDVDIFNPKQGRVRQTHIVQWKNFVAHDLTTTLGNVDVKSNQFISINNSESLVGFGFGLCNKINKKNHYKGSAFIANQKINKAISASFANFYTRLIALNEKGDAAGGLMYGDDNCFGIGHGGEIPKSLACLWSSRRKKVITLGNLTGRSDKYSFATNLNDNFQVVGSSEINSCDTKGQFFWHAFIWENNSIIDLGTLEAEEDSSACSINNAGEVVGVSGGIFGHPTEENKPSKGFYWSKESGLQNLDYMIDKDLGWKILWAKDINNLGQIVAFALNDDGVHVVILNPLN